MVIGVVAALGVAGFIIKESSSKERLDDIISTSSSVQKTATLQELAGTNIPTKCTFNETVENSESTGTTYIANGKLRGNFSSTASGKNYMSHMVFKDETIYTWMDGTTVGFKMPVTSTQSKTDVRGNIDPNKKIDFSCESWTADTSYFDTPNGIDFTDLGSMMNGQGSAGMMGGAAIDPASCGPSAIRCQAGYYPVCTSAGWSCAVVPNIPTGIR